MPSKENGHHFKTVNYTTKVSNDCYYEIVTAELIDYVISGLRWLETDDFGKFNQKLLNIGVVDGIWRRIL
jgi:hypothetical protein